MFDRALKVLISSGCLRNDKKDNLVLGKLIDEEGQERKSTENYYHYIF